MRTSLFLPLVLLAATTCPAEEEIDLSEPQDKLSYSVGHQVGSDLLRQGIEIDLEFLMRGVEDGRLGRDPLMSRSNMRRTLADLQRAVHMAREEQMLEQSRRNLSRGEAFLAENRLKEGVISLPSGLQYRVLRHGKGDTPRNSDTVEVHYRGTLLDGSEFESSYNRKAPARFAIPNVIEGWKEALGMMREGSHWELFIPPALAYGDKRNGVVEPNSTLVFEVELIKIVKPGR